MRPALALLVLAGASGCASPGGRSQDRYEEGSDVRQLNFTVGQLALEDDAWEPLDKLISFGVDFTEEWNSGILFLEGGIHYSRDRATLDDGGGSPVRAEIDLFELSAGLLLEWPRDHYLLRPYVGAGGSALFADADILDDDSASADDGTFGVYWKAGVLLPVARDSHVGIEVRGLDAGKVSTQLVDAELDSTRIALVFGASF